MQKKWSIAVVIIALAAVTFCIAGFDDNEAEVTDNLTTYYVNVSNTTPKELDIIINENYYNTIDNNHVTEWSYATSSDPDAWSSMSYLDILDNGTSYSERTQTPSYEFTLTKDGSTIGLYELKITSLITTSKVTYLFIKCSITINVLDGTTHRDLDLEDHYLKVCISMNDGSSLPDHIEYENELGRFASTGIHITEGSPITLVPVLYDSDDEVLSDDGLIWYAYDLPRGMAMTRDGQISGVAVDPGDKEPIVYVEDGYGNKTVFNLKICVWPHSKSSGVDYYLYNGTINNTLTLEDLIFEPTQFMTQRDRTVNLGINIDSKDVNSFKVSVVDLSSKTSPYRNELTSTSTIDVLTQPGYNSSVKLLLFELPTAGTGVYRVSIMDSAGAEVDSFDIYVLAKIMAVESSIIVSSSGSGSGSVTDNSL